MLPADRRLVLPPLTEHFISEVGKIAAALPTDRLALQWDVCQEVLAWEDYFDEGPVDFRTETIGVLTRLGDAVPGEIDLGYHLCYGSPADEHLVLPTDAGIMVEMVNIHHDDADGDAARLAAARRHVRVDGIATECGMARGDPERLTSLLASHARAAELTA
jgi:hypothetical protein